MRERERENVDRVVPRSHPTFTFLHCFNSVNKVCVCSVFSVCKLGVTMVQDQMYCASCKTSSRSQPFVN